VGLLPSGLDLTTARDSAIQLFSAEKRVWPNYRGFGVYALCEARIKESDAKRWSRSLQPSSSLNKFLRAMVVPAAAVSIGLFYAAAFPDVVTGLGLKLGEWPSSLLIGIGIFCVVVAAGFFLGFVHVKAKHMVSVYRAVLAFPDKPRRTTRPRQSVRRRSK
jgi:hypothetical protein